jgi:predicted SprT family Zn-dependent metalloprotease
MDWKKANRISKRLSKQYGIIQPPEVIPLKYSRMGKKSASLGYYDEERNTVELNKYMMICEWPDDPIIETIKHELIHALTWQELGKTGHDKDFRDLCKKHGVTGDAARATAKKSSTRHTYNRYVV